jgi:hypothetical protein
MNLSNLKPAEGSTKTRKRIGRGPGSVKVELLPEDIKEPNHVRVTNTKSDSKVGKCLYSADCQSSGLIL